MSKHLCHYPDCPKEVLPKMWGCQKHWFSLPQSLRNKVWRAYRKGQEITKNPSPEYTDPEYIRVMEEVQQWISENKNIILTKGEQK